jgi:spermidine synthase
VLDAARYLGETVEIERVYDWFYESFADAIQHDGVVVSRLTSPELTQATRNLRKALAELFRSVDAPTRELITMA